MGTVRQEEALHRLVAGRPIGSAADELALLEDVGQVMRDASICGLGQTAANAVRSAIATFGLFAGGRVVSAVPVAPPRRLLDAEVDGRAVRVPEGATILDACRAEGIDTPTMCYADNLTPINACRVCVVEVEGARTLVPACSRPVEAGMKIRTDTERVRHSRKLVMEFLGSSVDTSLASEDWHRWQDAYAADPARFGAAMDPMPAGERDAREPGHHHDPDPALAETVAQPVKIDNDLYVRDYAKCVLCYKCVEACGTDAQFTFAIAVAGRGFDARISTEYAVPLDASRVRVLRQLHRRVPDRRADVQERARHAGRRHLGRAGADAHEHDLPVLRRGVRAGAPRPGQHDREGDVAGRPLRHERPPLREGPVRVPVRAAAEAGARLSGVAGIVLAGGRSSRFGSDKLAAEREGVPLLHHAVLRVAEVADDVVVVLAPGASGAGLPPGVRVANDPTEGEGPLAGLHAGLLAAVRSDVGDRGGR